MSNGKAGTEVAKRDPNQEMEQKEQEVQGIEIKAEFDIASMVKSVGNVKLSEKQRKTLFAPPPDNQVEIRPDGIVYLPHIFYSTRLREAFGWEYALIPKGDPKFIAEKNLVVWGFYMVIKGSLMAYAIGHQEYHAGKHMTYIDAMEGAKSNATMRLCKDLGIATQLWEPEWREDWKQRWSYRGPDEKGKTVWKKKRAPNGEQAVKTEEYLEVEKAIKDILGDPSFTGVVNLVDKETGVITEHDLEVERVELLSRLNSPKVYGMKIMQKILARCLDEVKAIEAGAIVIGKEEIEVVGTEGADPLGDSDMPEHTANELFDADEFAKPDPDMGASSPQRGTSKPKVTLPPRGQKLPPRKNGKTNGGEKK